MRYLIIILLALALNSCMETDARVLKLQQENNVLVAEKQEILDLLDDVQLKVNSLDSTIRVREESFDSLMVLMNNNLMDTVWLNTVKQRVLEILEG